MKDLRDLKDLTIHDAHRISDVQGYLAHRTTHFPKTLP